MSNEAAIKFLTNDDIPHTVKDDGTIVVEGDVHLTGLELTELPDFSMAEIKGDFYCDQTKITNLKGAPRIVTGKFGCNSCNLTSLEGAPKKVGSFFCGSNDLVNLIGGPEYVECDYFCAFNQLTSLEGAPKLVPGVFFCCNNNLTSLRYAPNYIGGDLDCTNNYISTLSDLVDRYIGDSINTEENPDLEKNACDFESQHKMLEALNKYAAAPVFDTWVEDVMCRSNKLSSRSEIADRARMILWARRTWLKSVNENPGQEEQQTNILAEIYQKLDHSIDRDTARRFADEDVSAMKNGWAAQKLANLGIAQKESGKGIT